MNWTGERVTVLAQVVFMMNLEEGSFCQSLRSVNTCQLWYPHISSASFQQWLTDFSVQRWEGGQQHYLKNKKKKTRISLPIWRLRVQKASLTPLSPSAIEGKNPMRLSSPTRRTSLAKEKLTTHSKQVSRHHLTNQHLYQSLDSVSLQLSRTSIRIQAKDPTAALQRTGEEEKKP